MSRATTMLAAICLSLPLLTGCHAKFKANAAALGDVKTKTFGVRTPVVDLGGDNPGMYNNDGVTGLGDIVGAGVGIYQRGKEAELERRIIQTVDPEAVGWALEEGVANGLGDGPPFGWTDAEGRGHVLQLEIKEYGLRVPSLGAQGDFTYLVKMRIYTEDARRVYKARIRCEAPVGDPAVFARAFGGVNNVRQIQNMTDGELQQAFEAMARHCGDRIVAKMRRHAS